MISATPNLRDSPLGLCLIDTIRWMIFARFVLARFGLRMLAGSSRAMRFELQPSIIYTSVTEKRYRGPRNIKSRLDFGIFFMYGSWDDKALDANCQTLEHHFSIAYGRPPIIHEDPSITNHNTFIMSPSVPESDLRLHSQVDLFIILTRIYHAFGPDVDLEVPESDFPAIDRFDDDLRAWKSAWASRLGMRSFARRSF